jgi:signal transduction histidine kinase/PAS domain-containing protein
MKCKFFCIESDKAEIAKVYTEESLVVKKIRSINEDLEVLVKFNLVNRSLNSHRVYISYSLEVLDRIRIVDSESIRIFDNHFSNSDLDYLEKFNSKIFHFIFDVSTENNIIESVLEKAKKNIININEQRNLIKEVSRQNKEFEALNEDLESLVEERTFLLKASEEEEREKTNRIRQLIRFIKGLSNLEITEQVIGHVRAETRNFHGIFDIMLGLKSRSERTTLVHTRNGKIKQSSYNKSIEFPKIIIKNDIFSAQQLANMLGRPVGRIMSFPLELPFPSILFIEHSLDEQDQNIFIEFLNDRKSSLAISIERVLAEEQLRLSSSRWERTFDGIKDPIAIIDDQYNVVRANRKFSQSVTSQKCYHSWPKIDCSTPCEGCPVPMAIQTQLPYVGYVNLKGRTFLSRSYPIRFRSNSVVKNLVNHYIDVSQKNELYSRMIQSEKMSAVGLLAGNIAHELNNPLSGIHSLVQILEKEEGHRPQIQSDLKEIEKAAYRSQTIIKNLLEFSSGTSKQINVRIDELIEKTIPMLKTAMRNHRSDIELLAKDLQVCVQPHLMQQVIFNLVNNACQAMKDQGTLKIKTITESMNAIDGIKIVVSDTGPGIYLEQQTRIFEPFFTTKEAGIGTGLGLSIAKSVVESFNGQIGFNPTVSVGAEFWVWLPIVGSAS